MLNLKKTTSLLWRVNKIKDSSETRKINRIIFARKRLR